MNTLAYDTHSAVKRLKTRGYSDDQAEALVEEITAAREADHGRHATKGDLLEVKVDLLKWMFGGFATVIGILTAILFRLG